MASTAVIFDLIANDRASADFNKVGDAADRSGGKLRKMGQIAGGVFAGQVLYDGARAATGALIGMAKGAIEDAASQKRLATALENATGATKSQVAGVESWVTAQGKALGVADDQLRPALAKLAGATKDVGKAQKLASLAMDVSAGSGKSLDAVSTALAKAQNGNVAALSRLGISTKDAQGKTISFEEAQKRLAALHGGQAAAGANTLEGRMGRLKLALSEAGESVGAKLLPVLTNLATWFVDEGLPKLQQFGAWLSEKMPPIFEKVKAVVLPVFEQVKTAITDNMGKIQSVIGAAISIVTSLWNTFGASIVAFIGPAFENAQKIIGGAFSIIQGLFQTFSSLLKGDWSGVWEGIKSILSGAIAVVTGAISQMWNVVKTAFRLAGDAIGGIFGGIWRGVSRIVSDGVGNVVGAVTSIPGKILSLGKEFLDAGKSLIGKIFEGVKNAASNAGGFVGDLLGKIKSGINNALNLPLTFKMPKLLGGSTLTIIPAFANGTDFAPGGVALVGERGPELVNLPRGSRVTPSEQTAAMLGAGRGGDVHIHIDGFAVGTAVELGDQLEKALVQYQRYVGRDLQITTQ